VSSGSTLSDFFAGNRSTWLAVCFVALAISLAGCGSSSKSGSETASASSSTSRAVKPAVADLSAAEQPRISAFPAPRGRTLAQLARLVNGTATMDAANGQYTPGVQRVAFALADKAQRLIYAPTAVYVASSPTSPASGPYLAPDDPVGVEPQFSSEQNSGPGELQAIYSADIPLPRSGIFYLLALTRQGSKLIGSTGEAVVALSTPIPAVSQRPPAVATDTPASVHGNVSLLTTRRPPEDMHSVSFNQVLGKRPIALLFSTPQLCTSRVCGPVTDIMVQLQHEFGGRIAFIHQEVYVDNMPSRGLRPQLRAFHLQSEPWLFTVNRRGVIAARVEGAFGIGEARQALEAALR
jgi:hypothetical protein